MRAIIGSDDNSDLEDGDKEILERSDMPRKDQIMRHKGNIPRKKEEESNPQKSTTKSKATFENQNKETTKYATYTNSPRNRSKSKKSSGLYCLNYKEIDAAILKLKPVKHKPDSFFTSPSRDQLNAF